MVTDATIKAELERRFYNLSRSTNDRRLQALILEHCSRNLIDWINDWVFSYDPRRKPSIIPFRLFPKQEEYLHWRQAVRKSRQNGVVEKSRDVGCSWLAIAHHVHCWLFETGYKGSLGSRKESYVDQIGNIDSLLEKARFILRNLPKWMLPQGFEWSTHDNFCKLINPDNGSTITGESGASMGRGGRSSVYDLDEAAFIEHFHKTDAALSNNSDCIFYVSSVNGHNEFYKKRMNYPPECVFTFRWQEDPRKDQAWYEGMCKKYDPVIVASELDLNYGASVEGIYIPAAWVQAAVNLDLPRSGPPMAALDVARFGKNKNVLGFREGPVVYGIEDWGGTDTTYTTYKAKERVEQAIAISLAIDADGVGGGCLDTLSNIPELKFVPVPIHGAGSPSDRYWEGEERTSKEKFYNARAERWGLLHQRFKKTYDHVRGVEVHPLDELISIPNHPSLVAQISQPKRRFASNGKTLIESKEDMEKRGLESPDFADMLSQLFALEPHDIPQPGFSFESLGARESIAGLGRGWS